MYRDRARSRGQGGRSSFREAAPPGAACDDRYRVPLSHLDRQHHRIFAILDRARYLEMDDQLGIETILNVLAACVRRHFVDEQDLLVAHGYPEIGRQKQEHERVLGEVRSCQEYVRDGRTSLMVAAFVSIGDWFARHLVALDHRDEPLPKARGCR
jgi:hemerythrin-like metal-binding protein